MQLSLPSTGPDPIAWDDALAAVLGYARGRRPLRYRAPNDRVGKWASVPAFSYERFDRLAASDSGDRDVLIAEGLHGRLDPAGWTAVRAALDEVRPLADAALARAAGRAFWELPPGELSVLEEPGTVGALLRDIEAASAGRPQHVFAALHHRCPTLFPLIDRTTRWQLWPHTVESDSGVPAVIHRELVANAAGFAALESTVAGLLAAPLTRLRLHDVLLWLAGSLRVPTAVAMGRTSAEWAAYRSAPAVPQA